MPAPPYAKILVSINGSPLTSGGVVASFGDDVELYAESTIGWSMPVARWEITSYPEGWDAPAGWSIEAVTGVYYVLGNVSQLPAFTLPSATSLWGKFKLRLIVNGGGGALTDETTTIEIPSLNGVHDLARGESAEFGGWKSWVGPHDQNLRTFDRAIGVRGQQVTTTNATATALLTLSLLPGASLSATVTVLGVKQSGLVRYFGAFQLFASRAAGAPTIHTFSSAFVNDLITIGGINAVVVGNTIEIQATGVAATAIDWVASAAPSLEFVP